jgi:hypothetical protein
LASSVPDPIEAAPSLKMTVPVGTPVAGDTAVTVAVNVTASPKLDGLSEDTNATFVVALFTICVTMFDCDGS